MCTITFPIKVLEENLRILKIQTMTKKGTLSAPQTIGLYTSEFEEKENIPPRPNSVQASALSSIQKKVNYILKPLNDEAWNRERELEKAPKLNLRNKSKRSHKSPVS